MSYIQAFLIILAILFLSYGSYQIILQVISSLSLLVSEEFDKRSIELVVTDELRHLNFYPNKLEIKLSVLMDEVGTSTVYKDKVVIRLQNSRRGRSKANLRYHLYKSAEILSGWGREPFDELRAIGYQAFAVGRPKPTLNNSLFMS